MINLLPAHGGGRRAAALMATVWYLLVQQHVWALQSASIGVIDMQLRSQTNTNPDDMIGELLALTGDFLNRALAKHYKNDDRNLSFSRVRLSVSQYDLADEQNSVANAGFVAAVQMSGAALFETNPVDTHDNVLQACKLAFAQHSDDFLQLLSQAFDPFLSDMSYAVVKVGSDEVVQGGPPPADESSQRSFVIADELPTWVIAMVAGGCAFLIVFLCCICCLCLSPVPNPDDKTILRKATSKTSSRGRSSEGEEDDEENGATSRVEPIKATRLVSPRSTKSLSPMRSITSCDSSKFTFNPRSVRASSFDQGDTHHHDARSRTTWGEHQTHATKDSFFSAGGTAQNVDVHAWTKGGGGKASNAMDMSLFGQDISAIENKRDLSLIDEKSDEDNTPDRRRMEDEELRQQKAHKNTRAAARLSKQNVVALERGRMSSHSSNQVSKKLDLSGSAKDVIDELNDLSFQISALRPPAGGGGASKSSYSRRR